MPAIDITRPVELTDGRRLTRVEHYSPDLFRAYVQGEDDVRLFYYATGAHLYETLPNARNVVAEGEHPDVPETAPEAETTEPSYPFDPEQPLELDDGTPVRISNRDPDDARFSLQVVLLEDATDRHGRNGFSFWLDNEDAGRAYNDDNGNPRRVRNVDPSIPPHVRKARREFARVPDDLKPDFLVCDWFQPYADIHFPMLVERDEIAMVSFYENERKLEADRRTEMRVGRYVRRFNGGKLKDEDVERIAAASDVKLRGNRVKITQNADEIEEVYINGPNSCMSDDAYSYDTGGIHPSRVYAGPDLGIAYIGEPDDPSSRCVVWPEKKLYGRIYGDETRMAQMLKQMGYEKGSMRGARVQLIECDDGYVMPYVDNISGASISGGYAVLGKGHDLDTSNTNGLGGDNRVECERCESRVNDDETSSVYYQRHYASTWCDSCVECHAVYAENYNYGTYIDADCALEVHTADGDTEYRPEWDLGEFVRVEAGEREDEYWPETCTITVGGEVYHLDDAPETDEDADDIPAVTVEEAEAAGQMALPLTPQDGLFRLWQDVNQEGRRNPEPLPCTVDPSAGNETEALTGTWAQCRKVMEDLSAAFPLCVYRLEPVVPTGQFRVRRTGEGTTGHCYFRSIVTAPGDDRSGTYEEALQVQEYLTGRVDGRHVYTIEPVTGEPEDLHPIPATADTALAIAA